MTALAPGIFSAIRAGRVLAWAQLHLPGAVFVLMLWRLSGERNWLRLVAGLPAGRLVKLPAARLWSRGREAT